MESSTKLNEMSFMICGGGRINESEPIVLQDYVAPIFLEKNAVEIRCCAPNKIRFSKRIGKTVYDVVGLFDIESKQSALQQFKQLILANS